MNQALSTLLALTLLLSACTDQKSEKSSQTGMKCGAGKCGANMVDGHSVFAQKQRTILTQMRQDDPRKGCVMNAGDVKALYACVRDPETGKLSTKCGNATEKSVMKCGGGMKCGSTMKCGAGKCG